jgi:DNA-binding transcriptional ArsR family regulator
MPMGTDLSSLSRLLGEPARAEMCVALLGGQALSAGELARAAGVAPSTASEHLSLLVEGGLLAAITQGRHRYYRLAGPEVGELVEYLSSRTAPLPARSLSEDRRRAQLRVARTCYDHLAGVVAVSLAEVIVGAGALADDDGAFHPTPSTEEFFAERGIGLEATNGNRRPLVRSCLDWTERRPHVAGRLGAALLQHLLDKRAISGRPGTRAVRLNSAGSTYLSDAFGLDVPEELLVQSGP